MIAEDWLERYSENEKDWEDMEKNWDPTPQEEDDQASSSWEIQFSKRIIHEDQNISSSLYHKKKMMSDSGVDMSYSLPYKEVKEIKLHVTPMLKKRNPDKPFDIKDLFEDD